MNELEKRLVDAIANLSQQGRNVVTLVLSNAAASNAGVHCTSIFVGEISLPVRFTDDESLSIFLETSPVKPELTEI